MKSAWLLISLMTVAGMIAIPYSAAAEQSAIGVGDFWEYELSADLLGTGSSINLTYRDEIVRESTRMIGGVSTPVLIGEMTLNSSVTLPDLLNISIVDVPVTISMSTVYLKSNFSTVSMTSSMDASVMGFSVSFFTQVAFDPPMNLYVGDENLTVGNVITSRSTATASGWTSALGQNTTIPEETSTETLTMEVVAADVQVTVPAGTFSCFKIKETQGNSTTYAYYSERVGNYVKIESPTGGLDLNLSTGSVGISGEFQLTKYSFGSTGGVLSIQNVAMIGGVVVIVVIVAIALVLFARRKRPAPVSGQPFEQAPPPPPPNA